MGLDSRTTFVRLPLRSLHLYDLDLACRCLPWTWTKSFSPVIDRHGDLPWQFPVAMARTSLSRDTISKYGFGMLTCEPIRWPGAKRYPLRGESSRKLDENCCTGNVKNYPAPVRLEIQWKRVDACSKPCIYISLISIY